MLRSPVKGHYIDIAQQDCENADKENNKERSSILPDTFTNRGMDYTVYQ
jgi:hypothetical protein